jgi:hypothetical protein
MSNEKKTFSREIFIYVSKEKYFSMKKQENNQVSNIPQNYLIKLLSLMHRKKICNFFIFSKLLIFLIYGRMYFGGWSIG